MKTTDIKASPKLLNWSILSPQIFIATTVTAIRSRPIRDISEPMNRLA
jgi:hypothetical protein